MQSNLDKEIEISIPVTEKVFYHMKEEAEKAGLTLEEYATKMVRNNI